MVLLMIHPSFFVRISSAEVDISVDSGLVFDTKRYALLSIFAL